MKTLKLIAVACAFTFLGACTNDAEKKRQSEINTDTIDTTAVDSTSMSDTTQTDSTTSTSPNGQM